MVRPRRGLALLLMGLLAALASGQQQSPLRGQGIPEFDTTEVYVSVYLNRLLEVDDSAYLHRNSMFMYVSWYDPTAYDKVQQATTKMLNGSACSKPCTNLVENAECCDGIFLPSFTFRNLYAFPEDRLEDYRIYVTEWGATVWSTIVHGVYFQPMDFSHFPFDSFDLIVELEFWSTSYLVADHPGIDVVLSSGGPKLYSLGKGDDTAQWDIVDFRLEAVNNADMGQWFLDESTIESDPNDPAPLNPAPGSMNCTDCNIFSGVAEQWVGIYITVSRFQTYQLLNSVLPVVLCAMLGFIIFFLDMSDLASRLEIVATLFLALTAVQFVLVDKTPVSSYVIPTQQLVITTYLLLGMLALESVTVCHITTFPQRKEAAKRRKEGLQRYRSSKSLSTAPPQEFESKGDGEEGCDIHDGSADVEHANGRKQRFRGLFGCYGKQQGGTRRSSRRPPAKSSSMRRQLEQDEAYAEYVAYVLDIILGCALLVAFIIAAVLIFVLQDGYIDLFA